MNMKNKCYLLVFPVFPASRKKRHVLNIQVAPPWHVVRGPPVVTRLLCLHTVTAPRHCVTRCRGHVTRDLWHVAPTHYVPLHRYTLSLCCWCIVRSRQIYVARAFFLPNQLHGCLYQYLSSDKSKHLDEYYGCIMWIFRLTVPINNWRPVWRTVSEAGLGSELTTE